MNARSFAQLLLLGALWGAAFMFMRVAVPEFGAISTAAARVGLACVMMFVVMALLRQSFDFRARWKTYLGIGAVNTAIPFIAYCFAALHIPTGYSAIGNSTTPVWSALIAWLWFKERLGPLKWAGIAFAFSGVLVLVGLQKVALTPMVILGMLAVVLAAAMYATASFLISRYLKGQSGLASATGMVWGATVWLALPGMWFAPAVMPSNQALGALFALSLFCTVVGYIVFFNLIKTIGPQRASSVAFLFPAFAAFWGWLVLNEPITANMLAGMLLVLVGTALVSLGTPSAASASASALRPVSAWERLRDQVLLPMAFGLSPMLIRRPLASWIRGNPNVFRVESAALVENIHTLLPEADAQAAAADLRLTRVADYADLWVSLSRSDRWMKKHVQVSAPERLVTPALFVTFHYGGGWWLSRYLRLHGQPISIVMQRGGNATTWAERVVLAFGTLRMKAIERVCAAPLIYTDWGGAARAVLKTWKQRANVLGLIDLPPPLVDRVERVSFFGRDAYFPPSLFELAQRKSMPVYVFVGQWDSASLQPRLDIVALELDSALPAQSMLQEAITTLETAIRKRPGGWHAWGDAILYFAQKNHKKVP